MGRVEALEVKLAHPFPSEAWLRALDRVLNSDARYADVARKWEGDIVFVVESDEDKEAPLAAWYLDLWHGRCRKTEILEPAASFPASKFTLRASRRHFVSVIRGEVDPMQAMMTRRLRVEGNMAYMLRNVPTVLDFVRCCRVVGVDS